MDNEEQQRVPPTQVTTLSSRQVVQVEMIRKKWPIMMTEWTLNGGRDLISVLGASQKTKQKNTPNN